jgi:signal peptidase II
MKKLDWFFILFPLFFTWLVDYYSKIWASSLETVHNYGYLHFALNHNHGALLGLFSELPPLLRIVSLSTVGTFLVFSYAAIQYILPIKSLKLRLGLSLLVGGIVGNVTDRIIWGYVIDFIILGEGNLITPPFNLADLIQWIGYFLICMAIIRDGELLWPEQNTRKKIWINHTYQYRYISLLIIIGLSLALIAGVFSYTFLRVTIIELIGKNNYVSKRFLIPYLGTYISICLIFCVSLVLLGRILSHRTAGPIYAFQKFLEDLLNGKIRNFKLRTGDDFKQLEILAKQIIPYFVARSTSTPNQQSELTEKDESTNNLTDMRDSQIELESLPIQGEEELQVSVPNSNILQFRSTKTEYRNKRDSLVIITTCDSSYEHQEEG